MLRILFGVSGQLRPRRTNKATKQSPSNSRQSDPDRRIIVRRYNVGNVS